MAQLGARLDGIEEVVGSNPIGSTINPVDSIALPGCPYPKLALYHPGFGPILDLSGYRTEHASSFSRFRPLSLALCATLWATLFLAAPLAAQEKPEAPKRKPQFNRKVYVARVSILAACVMIS